MQGLSSRSLAASLVWSSCHSRSHAEEMFPEPALQPWVTELGPPPPRLWDLGKPRGPRFGEIFSNSRKG